MTTSTIAAAAILASTLSAPVLALTAPPVVHHQSLEIQGVNVFYREAGPANAPTVLLLHGFGASSYMFRNLIPQLAGSTT